MLYLPAIFVSSVFGTSFFDFNGSRLLISSNFWLYWAIAIPLTLVTVIVWFVLYQKPFESQIRELQPYLSMVRAGKSPPDSLGRNIGQPARWEVRTRHFDKE